MRWKSSLRSPILLASLLGGLIILGAVEVPIAHADNAPSSPNVGIDNFTFTPAEITVAVGTTVTWVNNDDIPHTVTDADTPKKFKSPPLDTGEKYAFKFEKAGIYHYFCSLHAHMQGTVVVK